MQRKPYLAATSLCPSVLATPVIMYVMSLVLIVVNTSFASFFHWPIFVFATND